jgi:hypothetical protein
MSKKAIRKLVMENESFSWTVMPKLSCRQSDYVYVGIWLTGHNGQKLNVKIRFDDPWLNFGEMITCRDKDNFNQIFETRPITPSIVRKIISIALDNDWTPHDKNSEIFYEFKRDTMRLILISPQEYKGE